MQRCVSILKNYFKCITPKVVSKCDTKNIDNSLEICTYLAWKYSCEFYVSAQIIGIENRLSILVPSFVD